MEFAITADYMYRLGPQRGISQRRLNRVLHEMNLPDRDSAVLNFKTNLPAWRGIVAAYAAEANCSRARNEYHEVHLYCRAETDSDRNHLLTLSDRFNLWAGRFRFTHEQRNGELTPVTDGLAREEIMLGTHFHMPSQLVDIMSGELLGVARQLGIDVERIRVEKPMGRSPARVSERSDRGWWEAHLSIEHGDNFSESLRCEGIRDVSRKVDFISGEGLKQGFVNIEARDQPVRRFAANCIDVAQTLSQRTGRKAIASLEQVLVDLPTALLI